VRAAARAAVLEASIMTVEARDAKFREWFATRSGIMRKKKERWRKRKLFFYCRKQLEVPYSCAKSG
jgi:hypothetical protein